MANQDYLSVELKLDFVVLLKMKMTRKQRNIFWKYSLRWFSLPITKLCLVSTSELNLHIWNANSQSFARAKSEAKMAAHGGKFWTSVSVLFAVLYVSSSPLRDLNFQFLFGSTSKTFTTMEKLHRRNITGPVLHNRVFKRIHYCRVA